MISQNAEYTKYQNQYSEDEAVWDILNEIYSYDINARFIFVFDEWDFIFHQEFVTEQNKREYLLFLRNLLKDCPYVLLAYITGILPIAKCSSGSELNMFMEYTMISEEKFTDSFGFTDSEVDELYKRYKENTKKIKVSREGLRIWYNGYHTFRGESVYNPRSVVFALVNNNLASYWTSSGPYDKIFSAMVVYGFLNYENGKVSIPNKELKIYTERILAVGIGYDKKTKKHDCKVQEI